MPFGRHSLRAKCLRRERGQFAAQLLQLVSVDIHDAFDERSEHGGAVRAQTLGHIRFDLREGLNHGISDGDKEFRGKNKSQRYRCEARGLILQRQRRAEIQDLSLGP